MLTIWGVFMNLKELLTKIEKLKKELFQHCLKGAEAGDAFCMQDVANMYSTGVGTEINYHNSEEWDKKFQTTMNFSSEYNKAINYRLRGDILEYKKILERVVLTGDGEAALDLAKLYMVSNKEKDNIIKYLKMVMSSRRVCEASCEEAKEYLAIYEDK